MPKASVTLHLTDSGNGETAETGDIEVTVSGVQTTTTADGTVVEGAGEMPTVRVDSTDGEVQDQKKTGTFLNATFTGVPTEKTYTVEATLPGKNSATKTVEPEDFEDV